MRGHCRVIDGDTIVIQGTHIRLAGIDAPELDHAYGNQSKWALIGLCKGKVVTARLKPEMSYDRVVAECFLPDGRDLAAELVKAGLAIDWPKFSGGKYRHLEPPDVRKKLWRAHGRQTGEFRWHGPPRDRRTVPITSPALPREMHIPFEPRRRPVARRGFPSRYSLRARRYRWLLVPMLLATLVGCALLNVGQPNYRPAQTGTVRPNTAISTPVTRAAYEVSASRLNVRAAPNANAEVVGQLEGGSILFPIHAAANWFGISMADGRIGWVYAGYLRPAPRRP